MLHFLRRWLRETGMAAMYDVLTLGSEIDSTRMTDEQAARALLELLASHKSGVAPASVPAVEGTMSPPLPLAAPPPALQEPRRRPGRPRKFQEPPTP